MTLKARILILFGCLAAALVTASQFPLSLALSLAGVDGKSISVERVSGTVWNGLLDGVEAAGLQLGQVTVNAAPFSGFSGGPLAAVVWQGPQSTGNARLHLEDDAAMFSALSMRLPVSTQGLRGIAAVSDGTIRLSQNGCQEARGNIVFSSAQGNDKYSGALRCEAGMLIAAMNVGAVAINIPLRRNAL